MLYLYYGDDTYGLEKHLTHFRERYLLRYPSGLNFLKMDLTAGHSRLEEALASHAMFEERRLIFCEGIFSVTASFWQELVDILQAQEAAMRDDVVLVFYEKHLKGTSGERSIRLKYFKKVGNVKEFISPKGRDLLVWIEKESKARGKITEKGVAEALAERLGNDTTRIVSEIEKLCTYIAGKTITLKDVERLIAAGARPEMWRTLEALSKKDPSGALIALREHIAAGEDPLRLLGMLVYQIRILLRIKDAESTPTALSTLGLHPFVLKKNRAYARNFSLEELLGLHHELASIDRALKRGLLEGEEALSDFVHRASTKIL